MRKSNCARMLVFAALVIAPAAAQVLSPIELSEPGLQSLQAKYSSPLQSAAEEIASHRFPYHFYFSRVLDLPEAKQVQADQRSIRFAKVNDRVGLEITANYYAAYSAKAMDGNARARRTFFDVMLPVLKAVVPRFPADQDFDVFALEVSHHVRGAVMGVAAENAENVVLILPRAAAKKLVNATTLEQQQAAVLDGSAYLDGNPTQLWLSDDPLPADWNKRVKVRAAEPKLTTVARVESPAASISVSSSLIKPEMPARLIAPDTLKTLQATHEDVIGRMVKELAPQAHFVSYAPPAFIAFHQGAYLQVSMTTTIDASPGATRYAAAALAFDEHISHLVRPVLAFFQQDSSFDGVSYSTTVKAAGGAPPFSAEFLVPFSAMRCYAQYDCTGQQLIDSSIVLINGERAGVDLQRAESTALR
ncbi:MAG: hypothetical protein JO187_03385 [Acidobacteria bacterium]|nr:hypothetical protein [Acidobacteriota bacterium]